MSETPSYYAIIPANVRYDKKLCPNAKLLYGEITSLCNKEGYCWAGNAYFAKLYEVVNTTISEWIRKLREGDYIKVEVNLNGSRKIRLVTLAEHEKSRSTPSGNSEDPSGNSEDPLREIPKQNIKINIKNNTHTQYSRAEKNPNAENKPVDKKPAPADPPMQHHQYPTLNWQELYNELLAAGFPDPGSAFRLNILGKDLLPYFDGLTREEIIAAIRNYGSVKQKPGSWWKDGNPNILSWAQKHITNFLSQNFRYESYFESRNGEGKESETAYRRRIEAEVFGGNHENGTG
jgi:hypothetical protein